MNGRCLEPINIKYNLALFDAGSINKKPDQVRDRVSTPYLRPPYSVSVFTQLLTLNPATRSNSFVLFVIRIRPRLLACAAIIRS